MDLNADIGEGETLEDLDRDQQLLEVITSANIACGGHAGEPQFLVPILETALSNNIVIGAHVSYPDKENFGRKEIGASPTQIYDFTIAQIDFLNQLTEDTNTTIAYIKPHGALYHRIAKDSNASKAFLKAIASYNRPLALLTLPNSVIRNMLIDNVSIYTECFADRAYYSNGSLVERDKEGAVISNQKDVINRAISLANGYVESINGQIIQIKADSMCLHSDTLGAVVLAKAITNTLKENNISIKAFI